jgi:hypothetical protein
MAPDVKRWLGLFAIVAVAIALVLLYLGYFDSCSTISAESYDDGGEVITNALVGKKLAEIQAEYGDPAADEAGYQPLALQLPKRLPMRPIRTLIFQTRDGTLWVWIQRCGNEWRCFESCWFAKGVVF